jgi:hypothetical protein
MQVGEHLHVTGQWDSVEIAWAVHEMFFDLGVDSPYEYDEESATADAGLLPLVADVLLRVAQETMVESVPPPRMGNDMTHPDTARITDDFGPVSPVLQFMADVPVDQSPSQHRLVTPPAPVPAQPPQLPEPPSFDSSNNLEL